MAICPACKGSGIGWADEIAIDECEQCHGDGLLAPDHREITPQSWRDFPAIDIPDEEWAWVVRTIPHASYNLRRLIWWAVHRKEWIVRQADRYGLTLAQWDRSEQAIVAIHIGIDNSGRPRGASRYVERPTHEPRTMDEIAGLL